MENKDDSEDAHTSSRLTMKNLPVTDKNSLIHQILEKEEYQF